jgi:Fe-S oxidoreductase
MNPMADTQPAAIEADSPLEQFSNENLYACYQCAKCSGSCPYGLSPQRVMRLLQMGRLDQARDLPTTSECASCMTCTRVCPKGLNPMRVIHTVAASNGKKQKKGIRSRIFANIHAISRLGSRFAPMSNWLARMPGAAFMNHHLLGIHKNRSLPPYATVDFPTWFRQHQPESGGESGGSGGRGSVLLFHDTFMDYNFPEIGVAATRLLERAGYAVELADMVCCGRPMISKGFHEQAQRHITENINRFYGPASEGKWIVGCEPSCLLALRDDYIELAPTDELREKARVVAARALLIDEFLEMTSARGENDLRFRGPAPDGPGALVFHSHCHHKALADPDCSHRLLEKAGYTVLRVCANCCGMAGSYGAEREHFDRSRRAFEEGVGLALRTHPDAGIAVSGVSCRIQITDLAPDDDAARCRPRHVVEWLRDALAEKNETRSLAGEVHINGTSQRERPIMSR